MSKLDDCFWTYRYKHTPELFLEHPFKQPVKNENGSQKNPRREVGPSVYQSHYSFESDSDKAPHNRSLEKISIIKLNSVRKHILISRFTPSLLNYTTDLEKRTFLRRWTCRLRSLSICIVYLISGAFSMFSVFWWCYST